MKAITLIEIIVALAISSIVIMAAYSFFNVSMVTWDYGTSRMNSTQNTLSVADKMEDFLKKYNLSLNKWYFSSKDLNWSTVASIIASYSSYGPIAIAFENALFLPFESEDEIQEHSKVIGFYFNTGSNEVYLYENFYNNETGNRNSNSLLLSSEIMNFKIVYFDENWDTIEIEGTPKYLESDEVKAVEFFIDSQVGDTDNFLRRTFILRRND